MGCSSSKIDGTVLPPPPDAFLDYYNLSVIGNRDLAGPFLKFVSYDPATHVYKLSVLVVCTQERERRSLVQLPSPQLVWQERDMASLGPPGPRHGVEGQLLTTWRTFRFWRFVFEAQLGANPKQLTYQVSLASDSQFFPVSVPAAGAAWDWAFYSCNGLDDPKNKDKTGGLQPLWRDLLARHAAKPFHAMVGGGDQLYNDAVFSGPTLKGWDQTLKSTDTAKKAQLPFTQAMQDEVEEFYFSHYLVHFSQPLYCDALATIPSLNTWDDHDIVDGWGSYPDLVQGSAVMRGLFAAAQRFYLLFQQHTTPERMAADGFWAGSSCMACLGPHTAVVLPDGRTYRTLSQINPPEFYTEVETRLRSLPPTIKHVVVVLAVPILYPKLDIKEILEDASNNITGDAEINALLQKTGIIRKLPLRFGMVEYIDDLADHWDSREHVPERDAFLRLLMRLSEERGFRVSCISGDVHCGGYGMFHSRVGGDVGQLPTPEALAADPRFIPQIISSAIANVPPPAFVLKALKLAGRKPEAILGDCVMRMVRLRTGNGGGQGQGQGRGQGGGKDDEEEAELLLGQRNWCAVSGGQGELCFQLRCEKALGTGQVVPEDVFNINVPPLAKRR